MEYITSNKGRRKLAFENNIYIKQKVLSSGAVWGDFDFVLEPSESNQMYEILGWPLSDQIACETHGASQEGRPAE